MEEMRKRIDVKPKLKKQYSSGIKSRIWWFKEIIGVTDLQKSLVVVGLLGKFVRGNFY